MYLLFIDIIFITLFDLIKFIIQLDKGEQLNPSGLVLEPKSLILVEQPYL